MKLNLILAILFVFPIETKSQVIGGTGTRPDDDQNKDIALNIYLTPSKALSCNVLLINKFENDLSSSKADTKLPDIKINKDCFKSITNLNYLKRNLIFETIKNEKTKDNSFESTIDSLHNKYLIQFISEIKLDPNKRSNLCAEDQVQTSIRYENKEFEEITSSIIKIRKETTNVLKYCNVSNMNEQDNKILSKIDSMISLQSLLKENGEN